MIKVKRLILFFSALIVVGIICIIGITAHGSIITINNVDERPVIIIDAGHGGFDGGAVAHDGTLEKDINLSIATYLSEFMQQSGYNVVMTRTGDVATDDVETNAISSRKKSDLKNRLELMGDYQNAIFVSIHLNKFTTSSANGAQVFYSKNDDKSKILGENIQQAIIDLIQPNNKRVIKQGTSSTYLLKNATIPAVIVECGFLSNHTELDNLKNDEYQQKIAFAIYCGIINYYNN